MQALIASALLFLALILYGVHAWVSYERQERVRQRVAAAREREHRDLEVEREHQRQVMRLCAMGHVKLLQKAIEWSGEDPMMTNLFEEALAQEVDILRWTGGDITGELALTGEALGVSPAPLPPILQRLESIVRNVGDAVERAGFESWSGLFVVSPRGKLAQALERLLAHLASVPGKIEIHAGIEGRFAVLTLRSSAVHADLYASLATAMARNWIGTSRGEVIVKDGAYRITLPFERAGEDDGGSDHPKKEGVDEET